MPDLTGMRAVVVRFRRLLAVVVQLLLVAASNWLAFVLRFDGDVPGWALAAFARTLPWLIVIRGVGFVPFRLFEGLWRYTSVYDLQQLLGGVAASTIVFWALVQSPLGPGVYPKSIFLIDAGVLTFLLGGLRLMRRFYGEYSPNRPGKRVLVYGAGQAGELIVRDMKNNAWYGLQPVGFVDDDPDKVGRRIHGVPVLGTRLQLARIVEQYRPDEALLAIPRADPATTRSILRALEGFKLPIKTLPNLRDIIDRRVEVGQIRNLAVEDLLARAPVGLDEAPVNRLVAGRRVLVTGAGGSIGSELCRQIARFRPAALVMLERYENSLHAIRLELEDRRGALGLHAVIGDITDQQRVDDVFAKFRPEIIFHAAAHKHVPLMEENPCEAVKNNVRGTRILAAAADRYGADRFILISTDKAVNPTSVMGMSKRLAEMVVQRQAAGSGTSFSVVRFGNVLGSNGSVVPRFMEQIRRGGPVTITHPEIKRFFMLIPEAVQLVLHAAAQAESGAIYILEMGDQVKLLDMAHDLIRLSGLVPDEDIRIEFIGLRPGEKLYEELVGADEEALPSAVEKILCVRGRRKPTEEDLPAVRRLETDAAAGRADVVLASMRELVGAVADDRPSDGLDAPAAHPETIRHQQFCPACRTGRVHRSHARTLPERVRKEFTTLRLFRCDDCGWRGWLVPLDFTPSAGSAAAGPPPDLASVDSAIGAEPVGAKAAFAPRNLT